MKTKFIDRLLVISGIALIVACGYYIMLILKLEDAFNIVIAIIGTVVSILSIFEFLKKNADLKYLRIKMN